MKVVVSIVLYRPDVFLLRDVLFRLKQAFKFVTSADFYIDLINNDPLDNTTRNKLFEFGVLTEKVCFVDAGGNVGYGAGNNISMARHPDSDYHLVLNPDALVFDDTLIVAINFLEEHTEIGLLTPKVVDLDGGQQYLCKRNPKLFDMFIRGLLPAPLRKLFARRQYLYEMRDFDYSKIIRPVFYPTGCFMFFRSSVFRAIGGFDEDYFLHYEDADIGRRVASFSETVYIPSVRILHKWTRGSHTSWRMRWITIKSGLLYWKKWGGFF